MRIKLAYDDKTALIKTWGKLPAHIRDELERIHDTRVYNNTRQGKIQWSDVMGYAVRKMAQRDSGRANQLLVQPPKPARAGAAAIARAVTKPLPRGRPTRQAMVEEVTTGGQMAVGAPPPPPTKTRGQYGREERPPCWICEDIGGYNPKSHTAETCFCNPQAAEFRPEIRRMRLDKLAKAGR